MKKVLNNKGFIGLVGLIVVIIIVGFVGVKAFNVYFGAPKNDLETKKLLDENHIDTASTQGILESSKQMIHEAEQKHADYEKQLMDQAYDQAN